MASLRTDHDPRAAHDDGASGPDFIITYHGTVVTVDLLTDAARQWVEDNLDIEPWQWLSRFRIAIDPLSMESIHTALLEAGFTELSSPSETSAGGRIVRSCLLAFGLLTLSPSAWAITPSEQLATALSQCRQGDKDSCSLASYETGYLTAVCDLGRGSWACQALEENGFARLAQGRRQTLPLPPPPMNCTTIYDNGMAFTRCQ